MAGNPTKVVGNTFDSAGRVQALNFDGQTQAGNIAYNAAGQTTSIDIGAAGANQIREQYTFDAQTSLRLITKNLL